jgi:hypothetical protein
LKILHFLKKKIFELYLVAKQRRKLARYKVSGSVIKRLRPGGMAKNWRRLNLIRGMNTTGRLKRTFSLRWKDWFNGSYMFIVVGGDNE